MTTGGSLDHTGLKRTGLFQSHVDIGAKLVPFAGWEMPLQYKGILAEARAVRSGSRHIRRLPHGTLVHLRPPS